MVQQEIKFIHLKKGDIFTFKNFPKIDFVFIVEGRLKVCWFNTQSLSTDYKEETIYLKDYFD